MKRISFRLSDEAYLRVLKSRGNKTTSDYVRDLLFSHGEEVERERSALTDLLADVATIKAMLQMTLNRKEEDSDPDIREAQ